jgi:ribonuclease G
MQKKIVVNTRPFETRVAILEDSRLAELYLERGNSTMVGNVYKGKVMRVLPGMQSAFIDIGQDKDAFLYVEDVISNLGDMMDMLDDKTPSKPARGKTKGDTAIKDMLKRGESIMVQVAKDRIGTKGARVTSHVSLPGKYLVLMPTVNRVGISKKIEAVEERKRLRDLFNEIREPQMGYIVRTAAEGVPKADLQRDLKYLQGLWKDITKAASKAEPKVGEIYSELDLLGRILRDTFTADFDELIVDDQEEYVKCIDFLHKHQRALVKNVKLFTEEQPIFEKFGIEPSVAEAVSQKVILRSGGSIVIHPTEALVSIDVNSGKFVGSKNLEDTAFRTNIEAADAIVDQLRLREMGGIIVIDFIDMEKKPNRKALLEAFNEALLKDKAEHTVLPINDFGLVILTRKRVRQSLEKSMSTNCPYCEGTGHLKSNPTIIAEVFRELENLAHEGVSKELRLTLHPEVNKYLLSEMSKHLEWVCKHNGIVVHTASDGAFHMEQYLIAEI